MLNRLVPKTSFVCNGAFDLPYLYSANRRQSLKGIPTKKNLDRDEYPPAMFDEGGTGASVRYVSPSDNRGAGSCIGNQCTTLPDGTKVKIVVEEDK